MPIRRTLALLLLLGTPLAAQQPEDKMLERYRQVLVANPAEGIALERLWKAYADKGQTTQLIEEYRKGGTFAAEMILGHLLRRAGQPEEARAAYERAASIDPVNPLAPLSLGGLHAADGKSRESAASFQKAIPLLPPNDPRLPEILQQLGAQWLALGDSARASDAWEQMIKANPGDLDLRRNLADTYAQNHLPDRAIGHLEFLVEKAAPAERAVALQKIARIRQGAGDQDGAIKALERALALTTPGNWLRGELQSQLIRLHQRYHRTAELEDRWKKYAAENPRDLTGYLQLVDLYERLGELEHERFWLDRLTQLAPKNPEYRHRLARLLVQLDQLDPAVALYDALIAEQPANADFVFERARIDVQREQTTDARDRIARLLAARKTDETIRGKALEFYEQNRLTELTEQHLAADAAAGSEEAILALANLFFTQQREAEGLQTLQRLVDVKAAPVQQAAAHFKIAQTLKTQSRPETALAELERALTLDPRSREMLLFKGDTLLAQGQQTAAQDAFEKAVALSQGAAQEAEADQKLFDSFRAPRPELETRGPGILVVPGMLEGRPTNPAVEIFVAGLERTANAQPSEEAWLRIARWRVWNREGRVAQQAIDRALALNPKSIPAYELAVKLAALDGPTPAAVFHLMKLVEVDPPNRIGYLRRAGQLELQAGRVSEALGVFEQILQESPGNLDALTDLALTQQRADRWTEALDTWRKAYALSPASKKREVFTPLLRVLERLEMHPQAAELILQVIDAETSQQQQFQLFNDLLAHCSRNALLDWLRGQFETRRKLRADDYFTEMALGRILKVAGNKAAAFEVLADASYAAPNQAEALPELIREAEDLRKLDAAIKLQGQFVRIVAQTTPDGFEKLAQLQERNFDLEDAAKTWDRIAAKFPRDAASLGRAVEFQLRWGTPVRATELLRRVRALEPTNVKALAALANLNLDAGQNAQAQESLEAILKNSKPEAATDALRFPGVKPEDAGRLQRALSSVSIRRGRAAVETMRALRSFWVDEAPEQKGDREVRLNAIRQLAEIVREQENPAALAAWTERWRKAGSPTESLWALYYAGAGDALLDQLDALRLATPRDAKIPQAFIWLALQTGQFRRLGTWLQQRERTPTERDYLLVALGQFLGADGRFDAAALDQLFPTGFNLRVWQTATIFASRNRFREAAILGQRVFDAASMQRATFGRELAHWQVMLGEMDQARETLARTTAMAGDSLDSEVYAALRERYLLLPENERPTFATAYLAAIDPAPQPLHRAMAGALLRALAGDAVGAKKHLDEILELRALATIPSDEPGMSILRRWRMVLVAGAQLQAWHFDSLAIYFWEKAVADDALIQLEGEQAIETAREIRQRLYALHAARATNPGELQQWIDAYGRLSPRDGLLPLGQALDALGAYRAAIEVYRQAWERDPSNTQTLDSLLAACRSGGDPETAEAALWKCAREGAARANDAIHRNHLVQLADALEARGDLSGARTILGEAVEKAPTEPQLLLRLALLHERAKNPQLAEAVYRRVLTIASANAPSRVALANLLEAQGKGEAAVALLKKGTGPEVDARLAQLQLKAGQVEDALSSLERIVPPQHITPTLTIVGALVERGDRRVARSVIQSALRRTADAGLSFPLLSKAVELLQPEDGVTAARLELRRVRQAATNQPTLLGAYLDFAQQHATRLGVEKEFTAELNTLWADGAGPIAAGAILLSIENKAGDPKAAEETLGQLLAREDAGEAWLSRIAGVLDTADKKDWSVRVRERLAQLFSTNETFALDWARSLHQLGRGPEAQAVLTRLAQRAAISEETSGKIAQTCAELGARDLARRLFVQATRSDPYVRNQEVWLDFARLQLGDKDLAGAKRTLRTALRSPAVRDLTPVIEWLVAADRVSAAEEEFGEFGLTGRRLTEARRALFTHLVETKSRAPAIALIEAHPELLTDATAAQLRALAAAEQRYDDVIAILESALKETATPGISAELARVLADSAARDVAAGRIDPALAQLTRAHELQPALFEVARSLAVLQSQNGAAPAAQETLANFLAASTSAAERDRAQELLARLKAGGPL